MRKLYFVYVLLLLFCMRSSAQSFEFTENKGQWNKEVRFKGELSAGALFLLNNGYRVVQYQHDQFREAIDNANGHPGSSHRPDAKGGLPAAHNSNISSPVSVATHAYDVLFAGASPRPFIAPEKDAPGVSNYFIGNNPAQWASGVKSYQAVVYKDIYPGVDIRYYSENGFLKYDMIVQAHASPEKIKLEYKGVDGLELKNGDLYVKTSVTTIKEQYPYCYQIVNGIRQQVKCRYEVNGSTVGFRLSGYDKNLPLVIDPTLVFSTFVGSRADNWGYTATYDANGNMYGGGIVFGSGYPVTTGAYQSNFGGGTNTGEGAGFDIGITKLNANGSVRIYATYIGGKQGNEQPHSLVADAAGNVVIAGSTTSADYPATLTVGNGGGWDIILSKLNANGTALVGSVRMGGDGTDGVNIKHKYGNGSGPQSLYQNYGDDARSEVLMDPSGNVLLASCSQSGNFPVSPGAFQSSKAGAQDAVVIKFNPSLSSLLFSTYLGGTGDDAAYVLAMPNGSDIYVAGGTTSKDFPGNKTGTIQPAFGGGAIDGFIARINSGGSSLIQSTYVGTAGNDQLYGIQTDQNGFLYFLGTSTGNFPVQNAPFSQAGGKQFVGKIQGNLSAYVYSTVFGSGALLPNISPTAFLVDRCENVYISGWGGQVISNANLPNVGTFGLSTTPDAIQRTTDGKDFYFFVLEKDATRQLYGSFFGQVDRGSFTDHVDGGTSRFDTRGVIYQAICANCGGGQYPTTPGVVAPSNPSGTCNEALIKIAFKLAGVESGIKSSIEGVDGDSTGCVPLTVDFRDTVALATRYEWNFGDGSPDEITTTPQISHTYKLVGNYLARLIAIDSSKCFPRDTSYINIIVRQDRAVLGGLATKLPPCESINYRFDNLSTPPLGKPFQNNSFTWNFGDGSAPVIAGTQSLTHAFPSTGTYNVTLTLTDTNYCNAPEVLPLTLRVSPNVKAQFETPDLGCAPYTAVLTNTSMGGTIFRWDFGDGSTSNLPDPVKLYPSPGTYTIKLVVIDSSTCNIIDSTSKTIRVAGKPTAAFTYSPQPPQENILPSFTNLSSSDAVRFYWSFGDGYDLHTIRRDTVVKHQYNQSGLYNTCLVAYNAEGCPDTSCQEVEAIVLPLVDVVSAFTPNNDGVNDRAIVYGFGVAKMTFRIYNRQGQMVFQTADSRQGWDGTFKGKPQPMDAYGYTLDCELIDGKKIKRSGSVTLIR